MPDTYKPRLLTQAHYHDVDVTATRSEDYYWIGADVDKHSLRLFMTRDAMETLHRQMWAVLYPELVQTKEAVGGDAAAPA
jgi:hypothetical protein